MITHDCLGNRRELRCEMQRAAVLAGHRLGITAYDRRRGGLDEKNACDALARLPRGSAPASANAAKHDADQQLGQDKRMTSFVISPAKEPVVEGTAILKQTPDGIQLQQMRPTDHLRSVGDYLGIGGHTTTVPPE